MWVGGVVSACVLTYNTKKNLVFAAHPQNSLPGGNPANPLPFTKEEW